MLYLIDAGALEFSLRYELLSQFSFQFDSKLADNNIKCFYLCGWGGGLSQSHGL